MSHTHVSPGAPARLTALALLFACIPPDESPGSDPDQASEVSGGVDIPSFDEANIEPDSDAALPTPPSDDKVSPPICGDGFVHPAEECDDGEENADAGACTTQCKIAVCGDGNVGPDEECDHGALNNDDGDEYPTCSESCELLIGCGDGVLQPSEEECDHDGPSDTCSPMCDWWGRVVFVTSTQYNGALGGLTGADDKCRARAFAAGLGHPESYRAWLSTDSQSIAPWLVATDEGEKFVRTDGMPVAMSLADFTDGSLTHPINVTEWGDVADTTEVWTNTAIDGTFVSNDDCDDWTNADLFEYAGHDGINDSLDGTWTDSDPNQSCAEMKRLYCVEGKPMGN